MAIARANSSSTANTSATTSHVVNKPAGVAAGDVVLIGISFNGTPGTLTWPSGFNASGPNTGQSNPKVYMAYKKLDGTEGSTFTITSVNSVTSGMVACAYTGVDGTTQMDATPVISDGAAATSATVTGITTVTANTMLVVMIGINSGTTTITENDAKVTEIVEIGGKKGEMDDGAIAGTGATGTIAYNFGASRAWGAVVMALRPSTGLSATVNQNSETDTAQAVAKVKQKAIGQDAETDTAQTVTRVKQKAFGQNSESETAQAFAPVKQVTLNQVTETDTAQAITHVGPITVTLNQVSETDTAQTITARKAQAVNQINETDTSQSLSARKTQSINQINESETAQAITAQKQQAVNQVAETDTSQSVTSLKYKAILQVTATDTAQPIERLAGVLIQQIAETDLAQALFPLKQLAIAQNVEIELAQPISAIKITSMSLYSLDRVACALFADNRVQARYQDCSIAFPESGNVVVSTYGDQRASGPYTDPRI